MNLKQTDLTLFINIGTRIAAYELIVYTVKKKPYHLRISMTYK